MICHNRGMSFRHSIRSRQTSRSFRGAIILSLMFHVGLGFALAVNVHRRVDETRIIQLGESQAIELVMRLEQRRFQPPVEITVLDSPVTIMPHRAIVASDVLVDVPPTTVPVEQFLPSADVAVVKSDRPVAEVNIAAAEPPVAHRTVVEREPPFDTTAEIPIVAAARLPETVTASRDASSTPPDFTGNRPPVYPATAKQNGWEGVVMLRVTVAADGRVTRVQIKQSSGYLLLDAAAANTVKGWQGVPGKRDGIAVESSWDLPVRFTL